MNVTGEHIEQLTKLRRKLHRNAELSGKEDKTAHIIREFLETTGPDKLVTGIGGNGLLARYEGEKEHPHILFRCELDALPIPEENDLEWKSENASVSHKCGHDGHMAMVCGIALAMKETGSPPSRITLLFQPSEETGEGARRVFDDPKFQQVEPDYLFALHNLPGYPEKTVIVRNDTFAAASIGVIARLKGESSHAAHPEEGRSPALAIAHIIQHLSAIPQFYTSMDDAAKVTIIHSTIGERAFGTSPGYGEVMATLRAYSDGTLQSLRETAARIIAHSAETFHLDCDLEWVEHFPATVNDAEAVDIIEQSAKRLEVPLVRKNTPFGWSEDFGHFTGEFRGAMFGLGSGENQSPLHAPDYDFPDGLIPAGTAMFLEIIKQLTDD